MRHFLHGEIYAAVENVVRPILGTDFLHLGASFAECAGDRLALQHAMVKLVREFLSRGIADGLVSADIIGNSAAHERLRQTRVAFDAFLNVARDAGTLAFYI